MSGPSQGSPVGDSLWNANDQSSTPAASATSRDVSSSDSRYGSPVSRMRAGSEWAVKTTCDAPRQRSASSETKPGSVPHARTNRVSTRPATASSKSRSYFAIESDDQWGASTRPTSASWPSSSAVSTAPAIRGSQWRMPVRTRMSTASSRAARVSSVIALSGDGPSESSIPRAR